MMGLQGDSSIPFQNYIVDTEGDSPWQGHSCCNSKWNIQRMCSNSWYLQSIGPHWYRICRYSCRQTYRWHPLHYLDGRCNLWCQLCSSLQHRKRNIRVSFLNLLMSWASGKQNLMLTDTPYIGKPCSPSRNCCKWYPFANQHRWAEKS